MGIWQQHPLVESNAIVKVSFELDSIFGIHVHVECCGKGITPHLTKTQADAIIQKLWSRQTAMVGDVPGSRKKRLLYRP